MSILDNNIELPSFGELLSRTNDWLKHPSDSVCIGPHYSIIDCDILGKPYTMWYFPKGSIINGINIRKPLVVVRMTFEYEGIYANEAHKIRCEEDEIIKIWEEVKERRFHPTNYKPCSNKFSIFHGYF